VAEACGRSIVDFPESLARELDSVPGDEGAKGPEENGTLVAETGVARGVGSHWLAWVPVTVLLLVLILARGSSWGTPEWRFLVLGCNFVFSTLASVLVAYLAGRSFLVRGAPGVLLLGCGVIAWGAAGVVANLTSRGDANLDVTIHNCGVWVSALLHLVGVVFLLQPGYKVRTPGLWLGAGYIGALGAVVLGAIWAAEGHLPVFFIVGQGGTTVRQLVLGTAMAMFILATALIAMSSWGTRSAFAAWYVGALGAITVGLAGILIQSTMGGLVPWVGRTAMWLAGVYMALAAVASAREASVWGMGLEEALRRSEARLASDLEAMTRLHQVGTLFVREGNLEAALGEIVETAIAISRADFGNIQLLDEDRKSLRMAANRGFGPCWLDHWAQVNAGKGACGRALERGERVIVEDVEQSAIFAGTADLEVHLEAGVRAVQSTPLMSRQGKPLGMLSTHWRRRCVLDKRVLALLDLLARQAADIIERAQAERALRESEERYRAVSSVVTDIVWRTDAAGDYAEPQGSWEKYTGQTWEQHRDSGWVNAVHPDDRKRVAEIWRGACDTGSAYESRGRLWHAPTQSWRYYVGRAMPLLNRDGSVREWVGCVADVHEQKMAEEKLEQLVAERTAELRELVGELEHFSYTITHDMRAPLRAMRAFAEILKESADSRLGEEGRSLVGRIITGAERMDALIADALSYSKAVRNELPLGPVDVGPLLRGMLDTYPEFQAAKADITIVGTLPLVMGNQAGLTQCFSNLLGNAVKFVQPGSRAKVRVRGEARDGWVRLWVEDDGIGISKEMLPRVFEMFARGSSSHAGTGIGLALVRKVVERMGGRVGVESELGQGTQFWVELKAGDLRHAAVEELPAFSVG